MPAITSHSTPTYRPGLTIPDLIAMVSRLLADQRAAEAPICRYLADLSDRIQEQWRAPHDCVAAPVVFADVYEAARSCFGMSVRQARERVRIGRALRSLPRIELALMDGTLGYTRVREVTRVATADTELEWLRVAQNVPLSTLEKQVAAACLPEGSGNASRRRTAGRCSFQWTSASHVELRISLRAGQWALVERAIEAAKRASSSPIDDAEALTNIAKAALAMKPLSVKPLSIRALTDEADTHDRVSFNADAMTLTGSLVGPPDDLMGPECSLLLETMATRGGWHVDSLAEACGLPIEEVSRAVTLLEIRGRLKHDSGFYQVM